MERMNSDEAPLPDGWIRQYDKTKKHTFYVDTKANPPRASWVHPLHDQQFLSEHPELKSKPQDSPPPYEARRHSYHGETTQSNQNNEINSDATSVSQQKRGFFGKIKDKTIGTKEERQARREEEDRQDRELAQRLYALQQQRRQRPQSAYGENYGYGPPVGDPYGYGGRYGGRGLGGGLGGYGGGMGYGGGYGGGLGGGGMGMGMPLMGGLAGGLLLGDMLGGGMGGGMGGGGFF